jgi:hypothetical protein
MMSIAHRVLIDAAKQVLDDEQVGRFLTCVEAIGAARGRSPA